MFTTIDKAWLAGFVGTMAVFIAEAMLVDGVSPIAVLTDPEKWAMALVTAVLVWAVPNKGTTYNA